MTPEMKAEMMAMRKLGCDAGVLVCWTGWLATIYDTNLNPPRVQAVAEEPEIAWKEARAQWEIMTRAANA